MLLTLLLAHPGNSPSFSFSFSVPICTLTACISVCHKGSALSSHGVKGDRGVHLLTFSITLEEGGGKKLQNTSAGKDELNQKGKRTLIYA